MPAASLAYLPRPRGCLGRLVDIVVIAAAVASVVLFVRREAIDCTWVGTAATCRLTRLGALEMRKESVIDGIHGLGHRSGTRIHLVTDARNKDDLSPFGMRQIDAWDEHAADAMESFLRDRTGTLALSHGPAHPAAWTAIAMLALLFFASVSRPLGFLVTIDPPSDSLSIRRRGPFFESRTERYALKSVRGFSVEEAKSRARVRLELEGRSLPLTATFSEGEQHATFVRAVNEALEAREVT